MNNLIVVCGPTATGKTTLALKLAQHINAELLSADSRQVYKGMNIGTGKDLPDNPHLIYPDEKMKKQNIGYYDYDFIKLWGYDMADPKEEFSVSHYADKSEKIIKDITKRGKKVIVVGGTGFYIRGIVDGIETSKVPKNEDLRNTLENKNTEELQALLSEADKEKLLGMNESDIKNPRRLVRAIEVARWEKESKSEVKTMNPRKTNVLFLGLTAPLEYIEKKIEDRVNKRIAEGVEDEIKKLLSLGVTWDMQSMNTLGYKEWREFFEGKASKEEVVKNWITDERKYAKRQITWFKKDKRINWFDITSGNWTSELEKTVETWHNN